MTDEPRWISKLMALAIHEQLLAEHGGASGLRDEGGLESALASPVNRFHYGDTDTVALAAAYALAISRNHPFVDGNKRLAFVLAVVFLELNGRRFTAAETEVVERTMALAARVIGETEYAQWLRANTKAK
jgi:death on curing protein